MPKGYLSTRSKNLKVGIVSYTESKTVLEVTGRVGVGTTNAAANLDINGAIRLRGEMQDHSGSAGVNDYVLKSTGSTVEWVDPSAIASW